MPLPGQSLYAASKFAVIGLSDSLRLELASEGIKVSVGCPGPVASDLWAKSITGQRTERKAPPGAITSEAAAEPVLTGVAQGRGIAVFPAAQHWGWRL